jgi:hypothetical protein
MPGLTNEGYGQYMIRNSLVAMLQRLWGGASRDTLMAATTSYNGKANAVR